jgi:hypothetical protein
MDFYEYWIGKDINLDEVWSSFDQGYIDKYRSMEVYMLRLEFDKYTTNLPLFDQEAIVKTIKSLFHDFKKECLSSAEYDSLGPIFLYEINRGSAIWTFLAELKPLVLFSTVISAAWIWAKYEGQSLDNLDKKLSIIKKHFPQASDIDIEEFTNAHTFIGRKKVIKRLLNQGLKKVELSKEPFKDKEANARFINMSKVDEED